MGEHPPRARPGGGHQILSLHLAPGATPGEGRPLRVLAIGAHCDDIEIGAGGTLLEWAAAGGLEHVDWLVCTSTPERAREAREAADAFLRDVPRSEVRILSFRDGYLPFEGAQVKDAFEDLKARLAGRPPDVILTHAREDRHQDHRLVSDLTWSTFRDHLVLEYEIPKYDGDLGQPNAYVEVSEGHVARKWDLLSRHHQSQASRYWFTEDTLRGLMRLRGIEARATSGFAEAFTLRKAPLSIPPGARSDAGRSAMAVTHGGSA